VRFDQGKFRPIHRDGSGIVIAVALPIWALGGYFLFPLEIGWLDIYGKFFILIFSGLAAGIGFMRLTGASPRQMKKARLARKREAVSAEREKQLAELRAKGR